ncbi:hypothetical protein GC194_05895 [bacterium]|nr:hypothetical protein [bacterium]
MFDQVVDNIDAFAELPAVKKVAETNLVKRNVVRFENYITKLSRKLTNPILSKFNWLNWVLINCVVLAFFLGKAHALGVDKTDYLASEFKPLALYTIISNGVAIILTKLSLIFKTALKVVSISVAILLLGYIIYIAYIKIKEQFQVSNQRKDIDR